MVNSKYLADIFVLTFLRPINVRHLCWYLYIYVRTIGSRDLHNKTATTINAGAFIYRFPVPNCGR